MEIKRKQVALTICLSDDDVEVVRLWWSKKENKEKVSGTWCARVIELLDLITNNSR